MTDFEPMTHAQVREATGVRVYDRWDDPDYREAEDVEFTVDAEDQDDPAWEIWRYTYPHREADARKYLRHVRTSHNVHWYRDVRNDREYGMPVLDLVLDHHEELDRRFDRAEKQRFARRRAGQWVGLFLVLTFVFYPLIHAVAPWIWIAALPVYLLGYRLYGRDPEVDYSKLTELRYDEFRSDEEIWARRWRWITLGVSVVLFWLYLHLRNDRGH